MTEVILCTQETCGACTTQREHRRCVSGCRISRGRHPADLETAEEYGVRETPPTLVYANGERTAEFIGIVDRDDL